MAQSKVRTARTVVNRRLRKVLATAAVAAALLTPAIGFADQPTRGFWGVQFSKAAPDVGVLASCGLYDTLVEVQSPISVVFRGGRGGTEITLAAGDFFGWAEPIRMTLTVDDDPQRWSYDSVTDKQVANPMPTFFLADNDRGLFDALAAGKVLHVHANGRHGERDYAMTLEGMPIAVREWRNCVAGEQAK